MPIAQAVASQMVPRQVTIRKPAKAAIGKQNDAAHPILQDERQRQ